MALLPIIASTGVYGVDMAGQAAANNINWPSANLIIYVPVRILEDTTVKRVFWVNGNEQTGYLNFGLYSQVGSKLWETGSTAQSGDDAIQFVDIADQSVEAGLYYMALQGSTTTSQRIIRYGPGIQILKAFGVLQEQAGSFALPSAAAFVTVTNAYLPVFGLDLRGAV